MGLLSCLQSRTPVRARVCVTLNFLKGIPGTIGCNGARCTMSMCSDLRGLRMRRDEDPTADGWRAGGHRRSRTWTVWALCHWIWIWNLVLSFGFVWRKRWVDGRSFLRWRCRCHEWESGRVCVTGGAVNSGWDTSVGRAEHGLGGTTQRARSSSFLFFLSSPFSFLFFYFSFSYLFSFLSQHAKCFSPFFLLSFLSLLFYFRFIHEFGNSFFYGTFFLF